MSGMIPDGYSRPGFIAAAMAGPGGEGLWPAMEFTYRPATRLECVKQDAQVRIALRNEDTDPNAAVESEKLACEFVAKRVMEWNLKTPQGADVPVSQDNCGRMQTMLFTRLYRIIRGEGLNDAKPPETEKPKSDEALAGN